MKARALGSSFSSFFCALFPAAPKPLCRVRARFRFLREHRLRRVELEGLLQVGEPDVDRLRLGQSLCDRLAARLLADRDGHLAALAGLVGGAGRGGAEGRRARLWRSRDRTAHDQASAIFTTTTAFDKAHRVFPRGYPPRPGCSGRGHLDPLAAEGHALGDQPPFLPAALGERAVGADDPPPGQVGLVALEEHRAGESGRSRRDVAVGGDEPLRDRPHALQHFQLAGVAPGSASGTPDRRRR